MAEEKAQVPSRTFSGVAKGDWPKVKAYYRMIDQPEDSAVSMPYILAPHRERTVGRMMGQKTVLCIQDGSDLTLSGWNITATWSHCLPSCLGQGWFTSVTGKRIFLSCSMNNAETVASNCWYAPSITGTLRKNLSSYSRQPVRHPFRVGFKSTSPAKAPGRRKASKGPGPSGQGAWQIWQYVFFVSNFVRRTTSATRSPLTFGWFMPWKKTRLPIPKPQSGFC
jgi:hypothetical protein